VQYATKKKENENEIDAIAISLTKQLEKQYPNPIQGVSLSRGGN
jgi:hypothetical protein